MRPRRLNKHRVLDRILVSLPNAVTVPLTGGQSETCVSHASGGRGVQGRRWQILGLPRAGLLVHKPLFPTCVFTWWKGRKALPRVFLREQMLFMEVPPSCPTHLPSPPPPRLAHLGLGFNMNLKGHKYSVRKSPGPEK